MSFWNQIQKTIQSFGATAKAVFGSGGALQNLNPLSVANNLGSQYFGTGLTDAQREQNQFNADEAQKQRDFEEQMSNTSMQRAVADYKAAGLNPMMLAGGSGASTPSGAAASSGSTNAANLSDLMALAQIGQQVKLTKAQIANVNADTEGKQKKAELDEASAKNAEAQAGLASERERGERIVNDFNETTAELRRESIRLANDSQKVNQRLLWKKIDEIETNMTLNIEKAHSEQERQNLMKAQEMLQKAEAWQIAAMIPYQQKLMAAQAESNQAAAEASRASALLSAANAAYQNKLLSDGYVDAMISEMKSKATSAEQKAVVEQINTSLRTGKALPAGVVDDKNFFEQLYTPSGMLQTLTIFLDNLNPLAGLFK